MDTAQLSLLNYAVAAAVRNDPAAYLKALAASHVLDGIIRGLEHKWPGMDWDTVYHAVAVAAADALYNKLAGGGAVRSPGGYLWKAAENTLLKLHEERKQHEQFDETRLDHSRESPRPATADRGDLRAEALRMARSLLPRLGEANIQLVMSFIFDCLEKGEIELDNQDIANATGLTAESVRRLKSRGFQRLRREARRAGITLDQGISDELTEQDAENPDSEDTQ
jgi:DNA-directed RNA polymerase specialized sigma24 family protein